MVDVTCFLADMQNKLIYNMLNVEWMVKILCVLWKPYYHCGLNDSSVADLGINVMGPQVMSSF